MVALTRACRSPRSPEIGAAVSSDKQTETPVVSVVIPTHNRPARVRACLAALAQQTMARARFEVIVVDDGSDAPLDATVEPFRARLNVHLIRQANAGPASARNRGARHATATLLAFTDDDCEPAPDWLAGLVAVHQDDPEAALGGATVNALSDNVCSTASQLLVDYLYDYHARSTCDETTTFFTSNNLAVPTTLFQAVGGFDESFPLAAGEDREFCDRWQQRGHRLRHVPAAVIRHSHNLSMRGFWRQHFNYGRGAFHFQRARLAAGRPAPRREPLSFYLGLIAYPAKATRARRAHLSAMMFVSQVANVLGYGRERWRRP